MSKSSSNIVRFNLKNKTKDIQGGEKKVMKKSLSVILSTAMALSMFSSVAFGKTSADFTDLKDLDAATKAKFDALISAGIFDGVSETTFGLKDEMNRAQFAKVAALITGIEVNKDLKTSSFSDVKVDDAANGYALPFIEALKTAGITDGYAEGQYNPAGKVTKEQLATFLVRVLGKDAEAKAKTGTDTTVSGWAQGYVALALELKLLPAGADGKFGGQGNATRDLLLTGAYEAKAQYVSPGKVSVTEAKATGVQKVTVTFNKPVDDTKAKVALTKGTQAVTTTTVWSDDKKTATLTLTDVKITEGKYTATVSGLDATAVDKVSGEFTAENEKVTKLDFVNASEKIAQSPSVIIQVKASNQYGENASYTGGSYTAYVNGVSKNLTRNDDTGLLELDVNTKRLDGTSVDTQPEVSVLPINVFFTNSSVAVQRTFKIGIAPIVSKIQLGAVKYPNSQTALTEKDQSAEIAITRFDQYGDKASKAAFTDGAGVISSSYKATVIVTPYSFESVETNTDDLDKIKVNLKKNVEKDADFTVTVYVGSSSETAKVSVKSAKTANKIEIGSLSGVLAEGDKDKYVPIIAYDAAGNTLSADDIVANAKDGRISIQVSGATISGVTNASGTVTGIVENGENKGKLKLDEVTTAERGIVFVNAGIYTAGIQTNATQSYQVNEARKPSTVVVATAPAAKAVLGASSEFVLVVKDQYGATLDSAKSSLAGKYAVKTTVTGSTYATVVGKDSAWATRQAEYVITDDASANVALATSFKGFNKGFKFNTINNTSGEAKISVDLVEIVNSADRTKDRLIKNQTASIKTIANDSNLTYALNSVVDLYAYLDSTYKHADDVTNNYLSSLGRTLEVTAKDGSGDKVAIPSDRVIGASSSAPSVVNAVYGSAAGKVNVVGNKAGSATVTVVFKAANGEIKELTTNTINVKTDAPTVATIKAGNTGIELAYGATSSTTEAILNLTVNDSYGIEYTDAEIPKYQNVLGLLYTVTGKVGTGTVTVDQTTGAVTITGTVKEFVLKAVTSNGKSATTVVTIDQTP
ncbi:S-layer homology domain-containing protein [Paenibacillus sp. V4I7]|uniref:S-layer homology domain-containing protein n=1 Tax=Paenibacillus sp. V4I7 TaxID=3042307 RepID=UPI0027882D48|nr:S-layer homology domain-containing protein [Paenibacillus sp. V4I7]MDQ0902961.1 hypothetical protein [Paenibacillus sp. V4I7]